MRGAAVPLCGPSSFWCGPLLPLLTWDCWVPSSQSQGSRMWLFRTALHYVGYVCRERTRVKGPLRHSHGRHDQNPGTRQTGCYIV